MISIANRINLIGRLGGEPETTQTRNGDASSRFSIAVDASFKDKDGNWNKQTHWHNVKAWGRTAELVQKKLQKGHKVMIEGRLMNNEYEKDGEKRFFTSIEMTNFILL